MLQLAQITDYDAINAMALQLHNTWMAWRPDLHENVEFVFSQDEFQKEIKSRSLYVARISDMVIGYVRLAMTKQNQSGEKNIKTMYIVELCVEEAYRRQGFGLTMMEDVRALAKAFGCDDLRLQVYPQNDEAVSFFQKSGFTIHRISMQQSV